MYVVLLVFSIHGQSMSEFNSTLVVRWIRYCKNMNEELVVGALCDFFYPWIEEKLDE